MNKWCGKIGYCEMVEMKPGVWSEEITERQYFGELNPNIRKLQNADQLNDDINIQNKLSIVADAYAINNFHSIRYAEFMNARWKITNVEVMHPRLILTLGGVWNGKQA